MRSFQHCSVCYRIKVLSFLLGLFILAVIADQAAADTTYSLAGVITYAGHPMSEFTSVVPDIRGYNYDTGVWFSVTSVYYYPAAAYEIVGLPDANIGISVRYILNGTIYTSSLPGNYETQDYIGNPASMTEYDRLHHTIAMEYIIHMTSPWDNNNADICYNESKMIYPQVLLVKWDEVAYADHYRIKVNEYRDFDHPDGFGYVQTILEDTTANTQYPLFLEKNTPYRIYLLTIAAYDALENPLGELWTTYCDGYGWDYRFIVGECPVGDLNHDCLVNLEDFVILAGNWLVETERFDRLNGDDIAALEGQMSTGSINGSDGQDFYPGTYFVYKTNLGRFGKFYVENLEKASNNLLTLLWITYNADGSIYSSGSGLIVNGTYSCDLDEGQQVGSGGVRDFFWEMNTSTTRYLTPTNGAKFLLLDRAQEN